MKRITVVLLLLTIFLGALAFAQQEPQKAPTPPAGKMKKMAMMQGMMQGKGGPGAMMGLLKLTDEQRTKIQDLRLAQQKEMISLRADLQKLHANMKLEITADKFNESKVKSIQGEISKVMNEMASKMILHQRAVRDLLTPEQKKQFDERILSGGVMGNRGGMRGGMMGPGRGKGMHQGMPGMGGDGMGGCKCEKMK
ncbi:MAG: Spy/CpxP family protein refolding chaperone [Ignavibacteriales bacterium]|nr:Spy/CpxP family protein refolding chaperone [Ignavibacteriales bacterium]